MNHRFKVVGDAIADLLAVESLLRWYGLSVEDWERSLYTNAPSVQLKVPVSAIEFSFEFKRFQAETVEIQLFYQFSEGCGSSAFSAHSSGNKI